MTTTQAKALRDAINYQAAELRDGEANGETKAEIRCRKQMIAELERQLTEN